MLDEKKYKSSASDKRHTLWGQPLHEVVRLLATGELWARNAARGVVSAHLDSLQGGAIWLASQPRNRTTVAMAEVQQQDIRLLRQALQLDWGKPENRLKVARKLAWVSYYSRFCEPAVGQVARLA